MKKFLSLVLALVMTMSLVTVSAGAADYADADSIKYVEAVDVLSAIGVLEGDATGFRPNDTLKRSEAAKIICALNLTPKTAATLSADTAPFADVAASHWAAGYIAEGAQSGIIAGVGNGKFAPDGQLTGYAYLKMLLVCLGYDASAEGMTGANWSVNVAKLAKKVGLTKGNDNFVGSAAVTREEAALYALNALKAETVEYDDLGTDISINGIEITTGASKAEGTGEEYKDGNYSRLKYYADEDNCGRPATEWVYKGETIGTYAKAPVLVITEETDGEDVADALAAEGYKKYLDKNDDPASIKDATYEDLTANGKVVEFYGKEVTDDDDKDVDVIYTIVTLDTKAAQVTKVVADKSRTEDDDESAIKLSNGVVLTIDEDVTEGVELDNFDELYDEVEEDTWVLVTYAGKKVVAVEIAEVIEGESTAWNNSDVEVKIDGEWYGFSAEAEGKDDLKKNYYKVDGEFVLDAYGYIIATGDAADTDSELVYVVTTFYESGKYNSKTYYAQIVNLDGEVEEIVIAEDEYKLAEGLYTYELNDDDEAEFEAADKDEAIAIDGLKIDEDAASLKTADGKKYYADAVTMLYIDDAEEDLDVDVADELEYVKAAAKGSYVILNDDDEIEVVVIRDAAKTYASADDIIYVASTKIVAEDSDAETKSIKAYVEGEKITIDLDEDAKVAVGFFNYTIDEDGIYDLEAIEDDVYTLNIDSIRKDKYVTLNEDKAEDPTEYVLSADAVVVDLSDEDMADIADLAEMAEQLEKDEALSVQVLVDEDDETITYMVIDIVEVKAEA